MKKELNIFILIILFIIINFLSLRGYYDLFYGKQLYENKDFSGSLQKFEKLNNYIGEYNKGNANYRIGEKLLKNKDSQQDGFSPLQYWEQALQNYRNSMKLNYTSQAEYNYNFVKKKLEQLKKKIQEEKKKQAQEKKQNSGENKKNSQKNSLENQEKSGEKKGEGSNKKGQNGKQGEESGKNGKTAGQQGVSTPGNRQISENTQKQLKDYEERLKQEQQQNAGNYGKVYKEENNPFDEFDDFFNNPFFDNSILDNENKNKDW